MICNFDDVFPYLSTSGGLLLSYLQAPANSPASGEMGSLWVPASNPNDGFLTIQLDKPIDPRNYIGISFLAQTDVTVSFILKLEQSTLDNSVAQIQDWTYNYKYTGNGEWQEIKIPFDVLLGSTGTDQLGYKLSKNPNFPAGSYDRIIICPGPYEKLPAFTLNMDNIRLRTSWVDTGIQPAENTDVINIVAQNGTISAKAATGSPVTLKVYSISGQEIASGINQVQMEIKGVYIVKATTENATNVQKVAVQ